MTLLATLLLDYSTMSPEMHHALTTNEQYTIKQLAWICLAQFKKKIYTQYVFSRSSMTMQRAVCPRGRVYILQSRDVPFTLQLPFSCHLLVSLPVYVFMFKVSTKDLCHGPHRKYSNE